MWSPSSAFVQVGYVDTTYYKDEDRYRGTWVHWATRLSDEGALNWSKLPGEYVGFLEAYEDFKHVWKYRPRMREIPIYHPQYLYGVTPDGEGKILDGDDAIVELKTGTMMWWTAIQTAAQDMAVAAWDKIVKPYRRRIGVELSKNGKFRAVEFKDPDDYDTWKANLKTCQRFGDPPKKLVAAFGR